MFTTGFRITAVVLVIALLSFPEPLTAQNGGEDEQQELPEIAPQEIEIRGELQLSFPSLQRQPLRGFATPTSRPEVPDQRARYVEAYKQSLDQLPDSLPTPDAVSSTLPVKETSNQGYLEMGVGRYLSRFAEGRLSLPLTSRQRLAFHVDYTGTDGFAPFSDTDVTTPSDGLGGHIRFESRHDRLSFGADLHGRADQYTLYGVPALANSANAVAPDRAGYSAGAAVHLHTDGAFTADVDLGYDRMQFDTDAGLTSGAATFSFLEDRLSVGGTGQFTIATRETTVDLSLSRSALSGDVPSQNAHTVDVGAQLALLDEDGTTLTAGAALLDFSSPASPELGAGSPTASGTFIVPQGRVELQFNRSVTFFAENRPTLGDGHLTDVYETNPYAESAPSLRPVVHTTNAQAGLDLSVGALRVQTQAGYRYAPSYRYFTRTSATQNALQLFEVGYGSAQVLHAGGQLGLQGIGGLAASLRLSVRDGTLVGDDTDIPYFSPVVTHAMLSYSFADQRGYLQTTGTIKSPRPTNASGTNEVGTYVAFDVEGSYEVTSSLSAVLRIKNIAPRAPKLWARYPEPPGSIMGGVRIRW